MDVLGWAGLVPGEESNALNARLTSSNELLHAVEFGGSETPYRDIHSPKNNTQY